MDLETTRREGTRALAAWDWRSPHASRLQQLQADPPPMGRPRCPPTWVKLSRALCRFACIPVGGSLVILIEFSRMPWGMMWLSGEGAGSALMKTRKSWWLPSLCCSSFFSRELSHLATRWMFWQGQRGHGFISPPPLTPTLIGHQIRHTNEWHPPGLSTGS